jgi:hypothetical protein
MTDFQLFDLNLTAGSILERTWMLVRKSPSRIVSATLLMTVPAILYDLGEGGSGLLWLATAMTLAMQYWMTSALLADLGLRTATRPRGLAFILLALVTGVAILVGLSLLILPGLFLLARWSIAVPAVIAADARVFEAINYSWHQTRRDSWQILAAFLAIWGFTIIGIGVGYLLEVRGPFELGVSLVELSLTAGLIMSWYAATAIYAVFQQGARYSEIFV